MTNRRSRRLPARLAVSPEATCARPAAQGSVKQSASPDLRRQSLAFLQQHFGKSGPWFHAISNGEDLRPVVPDRPRKSSGSETTFSNDLTDPTDVEAGVQAMADEVWAWCEKARAFGRTVTVKIKYADFRHSGKPRDEGEQGEK